MSMCRCVGETVPERAFWPCGGCGNNLCHRAPTTSPRRQQRRQNPSRAPCAFTDIASHGRNGQQTAGDKQSERRKAHATRNAQHIIRGTRLQVAGIMGGMRQPCRHKPVICLKTFTKKRRFRELLADFQFFQQAADRMQQLAATSKWQECRR